MQGEGGVHPLPAELLAEARALADAHGALLILDEVQTGVGRSGEFFAWQRLGVKPDAVTLAKGLANGLPIGALLVSDDAPTGFEPGDHASTFGGNPVACAAACAVRRHDRRRPARAGPRRPPTSSSARWRSSARCAASACCSPSSSTGLPRRSSKPRSRTGS